MSQLSEARRSTRWVCPTAILALLCLVQGAWANGAWPTEYNVRYKTYNSPTDNEVEVSYKIPDGDGCANFGTNPNATVIEIIGLNWCRAVDPSWEGQFWGPWDVGPDPTPTCDANGWKHGGLGAEIWNTASHAGTRICGTWWYHTLEDAFAPGLIAIGMNYYDQEGWIFHHNHGNHNTSRVFKLEAPPDDDDDEDDND